jgi:uncharacterized membrane protein
MVAPPEMRFTKIRREAISEYAAGSLWVRPTVAALVAIVAGALLSQVTIGPDSRLAPVAFQGTADDARALLIGITGTVVTVIALVLGLTVVALQLSSTQFSPRLLRNFLRDRPNQLVLSVFLATFAYTAAGLYTVGVHAGGRTEVFPRLAVSGSIVLLFASLGMVVFFADHLAHSIQIDAIMRVVESSTISVIQGRTEVLEEADPPAAPEWAVPVLASRSGYVQAAHPEILLPMAVRTGVSVRLRPRLGEHVVVGTVLAWIWPRSVDDPVPDSSAFRHDLDAAVRIGFERTLEQDAGLGIRQLVDIACKALSPAVNDPYTAVQAVDHLSVILSELARTSLGSHVARDPAGTSLVIVPGRHFDGYLRVPCGLIRRYGSGEPTVSLALLRMLATCGAAIGPASEHWGTLDEEASLIVADADREVAQPADLVAIHAKAASLREDAARLRGYGS